jgi:PAS domain S-box-containing protein
VELIIRPDLNLDFNTIKENACFATLSDTDFEDLKRMVGEVFDAGTVRKIFISNKKDVVLYYEVQFLPEFNSEGQVRNVIIHTLPSTKATYQSYLSNLVLADENSKISDFTAVATFNNQLEIQDYFTSSSIEYDQVFSNRKTIEILNKWLNNLFKNSGEKTLIISKNDTGSRVLNLNSLGKSKKTGLISIRIECSEDNAFFDSLNNIDSLDKNLLDKIPADIAIWDNNHRYVFLNKTACPNDEIRNWLIGKTDFDYCQYRNKPIDLAIQRRTSFNQTLLAGKQTSQEEKFETGEGAKHHLRIFQPLGDSIGQAKWVLGYGLDITSIKNIESTLNKMSIAVKDAMDGIAVLDEKGNYIYINEAHIKMFGYQNEKDFIGNSWHMLYEESEIERLGSKIFPEIMVNGRWAGETKGKLKNGNPVFQEISLTSLPDGGLICICRDKTEERNQKQRLERAAIVADNTSSVVIVTDPEIRIQWVNKAFTDVTGYTLEDALGKDPSFLHGPETDTKSLKKIFKRLMDKKGFSAEVLNYSKTGRKYWMQINTTPIFNEEHKLVNFISVENDITQLKQAEENIKNSLQKEKELNELKSQFVSIASHEIRTPLASIQSSSDLIKLFLESNVVPKVKIEKHLDKIESQITRLSTIMSNLLTVGRINLGKFDLHKNETDIGNFVSNIIKEYFAVTSDGRKVIFKIRGEKHKSHIDKVLMSQVLINLISNAVKYSIGKSNPEVRLDYQTEYFTIEVKDNGIGIPEDQHKNIFNSFFRANNVENIQGTGLGLVIVKKFVEMHKGKISFTSVLGKGTIFKIKFPYQ